MLYALSILIELKYKCTQYFIDSFLFLSNISILFVGFCTVDKTPRVAVDALFHLITDINQHVYALSSTAEST